MKRSFVGRKFRRRTLCKAGLGALAAATQARAEVAPPRRFLQIFLTGGWDTAFATDPVIGSKASGSGYEPYYASLTTTMVSGKDQLRIGPGLEPAKQAFANMSTAFINGMFVEVTAHELATNYLYSGRLSLSRSREYPSGSALLGQASGVFPPHLILGDRQPLSETALTSPPLSSVVPQGIAELLTGPYKPWVAKEAGDKANALIEKLDRRFLQSLKTGAAAGVLPWGSASSGIPGLYAKGFADKLRLDDATVARYGLANAWDNSQRAFLAGAYLALKADLTRVVTVAFGQYDTHNLHVARQLPLLQEFSRGLVVLCSDLRSTPDPAAPHLSLADTTTILITSEFCRTPKFNSQEGTDHWQSASAIVMGAGVRDNVRIGATDDQAAALGWSAGAPIARNESTQLLPDHLVAAILRHYGLDTQAGQISASKVVDDAIFT
jgi:hypothetical protein